MKNTIIYDPQNGVSLPDGLIDNYINSIIDAKTKRFKSNDIVIGSELIITALRAKVKISELLQFTVNFNNSLIGIDRNGRIINGVNGFCDNFDRK